MVNAPDFDEIYVQHMSNANTGNIPPHLVTLQKTGKCVCDCRLYKSSKICEHVVTAADERPIEKVFGLEKKRKVGSESY